MVLFHVRNGVGLVAAAVIGLMAGCASTAPKPTYSHSIVANSHVGMLDHADVKVDAAKDVQILPLDEERLTQKVTSKIELRRVSNSGGSSARAYEVDLHLTRYDKGNAFARAMLVGLGQIHIEGTISMFQMPERALVGEFDLKKTFAWGGIYGAATSMDDIENTFADAVAAAVTGQQEEPKDKDKKN